MSILPRVAGLLAVACFLAGPSLGAQRADSSARLDSTRRDSALARPAQNLAQVVVTGSLAPTAGAKLGVALYSIDRTALSAEPSAAATNPLRHAPGVHIDEANGPLGPTIIRLRGGEEQYTQILFDGVAVNENGGFFDWQGLTLVNVERVEIARGPQSAVFGTSAMSGAVQVLTRAGAPGSVRGEATVEGGRTSDYGGSRRITVESSGGSDLLRFSAGLGAAYDRGVQRLPNDLRSNDASLRLDLVPADEFRLTVTARYMEAISMLPVRDPGVTRAPLDPSARQGRDRLVGSLEGTWTPGARWSHRFTLADYRVLFTYDIRQVAYDAAKYPIFFFNANYHYRAVVERTTARYVGTWSAAPGVNPGLTLSYGGAWENETLRNDASGDYGPSALAMERPSVAGFAEAQIRAGDRWSFLGGARAESFRGIGAALVPRATAVFDVLPGRVALRAAVANAYKAPNIQDQFSDPGFFVGNPDLRSETSQSSELGVDVTGETATASVTAFRQRYDDIVRVVPFGSGQQIKRNLGRSRASGIEAEVAVHPSTRWTIGAQGAWTTTEVVDNRGLVPTLYPAREPLPFRPAYTASGFLHFPATSALSVTIRLSAVGQQTVLSERFSGSRVSIDPYQAFGATATYALTSSLETYLHAENLLNAANATAYDKPGAPRSLAMGIRARMQ